MQRKADLGVCARRKGEGGSLGGPFVDRGCSALHKQLDKHRGERRGEGCTAEAEPLEKGVEVGAR